MAICGSFVTGLASSLGPCAAPRYLIVSASLSGGASWQAVVAFAGGTIAGYVAYALGGGALVLLPIGSHALYAAVAVALVAAGGATLRADVADRCSLFVARGRSAGAMFLLGASCAMVLSPCCTPVAVALGMQAAASRNAAIALGALVAFGIGHSTPLVGLTIAGLRIPSLPARISLREEAAIVSAALLLAVGILYGVLA
jgi:cytochrome c biogenesis protein CcdA